MRVVRIDEYTNPCFAQIHGFGDLQGPPSAGRVPDEGAFGVRQGMSLNHFPYCSLNLESSSFLSPAPSEGAGSRPAENLQVRNQRS